MCVRGLTTTAGTLPVGQPQGPDGSNETNHGPNHGLTRAYWSLQVDAPATPHAIVTTCLSLRSFSMLRPPLPEPFRMDHPQVQAVPTVPTMTHVVDHTWLTIDVKAAHRAA
ncbi:hypothetical protein F511_15763 [Dorcoceras hygrometricum]|uniref:Uncharacterized protein n=1 Tax=Dorcoceras hygrometricum TaxID=472368 RepID=A0A2Z7CMR6_9LAMI|nr:hypothetical protein F511_15763 [Dorcoceras hygrometricum]